MVGKEYKISQYKQYKSIRFLITMSKRVHDFFNISST